ncbi:site-specific integrase [Muricoccus nepalensis]|nr:site-specific integrase [Roseomonas nepalensis]
MTSQASRGAAKLVLKLEDWPTTWQELWHTGLRPGELLGKRPYAAKLSDITIRNARRGFGAWLHVLLEESSVDLNALPSDSMTPANVRQFFGALRSRGNTDNTLVTRLYDIQCALRIMQPDISFPWLTSPGGVSIRQQLQPEPKRKDAVRSAELLHWGYTLIEAAPQRRSADLRLTQYRNGLLIVLFTYLAPRLRSMALLRISKHLEVSDTSYRIVLRREDNKTKRERIDYLVPDDLAPLLAHYLQVIRPALLGDARHDWLWVNANGTRFGQRGIEGMIWRGSEIHLGRKVGPHQFRHALATTAAEKLPDFPALAARILATSPRVVAEHYNRSQDQLAIEAFQEHMREERGGLLNGLAAPLRMPPAVAAVPRNSARLRRCQGVLPLFDTKLV